MDFSTEEIDRANAHFYNAKADLFSSSLTSQSFLSDWLKKIEEPILDIGAGTGALAEWLKTKGFEVLCLDPASEMILQCKAKGLEAVQTTIQQFQAKQSFSTVFALFSLLHVPKKELLVQFKKIARLLSSEGMFYFSLIEGMAENFYEEIGYRRFFATYSKKEIRLLLKKSHFELLDCFEYPWFYQLQGSRPIGNSLFFSAKKICLRNN